MGGGGLRILGHKAWHVWKRENIERVQRDERLAKEEEEKEKNEEKHSLSEFRIEQLKKKRKREAVEELELEQSVIEQQTLLHSNSLKTGEEDDDEESRGGPRPKRRLTRVTEDEHVNLFEKEMIEKKNEEYMKEQKDAKLKEDKRLGVAPWELGGEQLNNKDFAKPWYTYGKGKAPEKDKWGKLASEAHQLKQEIRQDRMKDCLDPARDMEHYLRLKYARDVAMGSSSSKPFEKNKDIRFPVASSTSSSEEDEKDGSKNIRMDLLPGERRSTRDRYAITEKVEKPLKKKKTKKKKEKKKKEQKKEKKDMDMERLRKERREREKKERERAQKLTVDF